LLDGDFLGSALAAGLATGAACARSGGPGGDEEI
jgi:hypothetical protein